ncbi:flavin reductase family protein [Candidatus Woesearchaeota archaeon]|nr:MAG: flavin reductase family protein [Candidatus Woesearchaeota archaeon]
MASVYQPRQVVLVTSRDEAEIMGRKQKKDNIITVAWHTPLSHNPFLYGIAIGKTRFSRQLIDNSRVFAVNFIGEHLKDAAVKAGTVSGMHTDKFAYCGLTKKECEKIDAPRIGEACAWIECEVVEAIETGDHIFYVGRVVNSVAEKNEKRLFQLGGMAFTTTRE